MPKPHRVMALIYNGLSPFEFGIVVEAFGLRRPELDRPWYQFDVCSLERGPVTAIGGFKLEARLSIRSLRQADTIVLSGWRNPDELPPEALLREIRAAHRRGARLVSICSGVFILAAAGVLDGGTATTHWRYADRLAERYPGIKVAPDVLYVDGGQVLTSAGSAAGIDLCLHIIRQDHGSAIANQVAKRMVMPPHRDGGQAQYIHRKQPEPGPSKFVQMLDWAQANLDQNLSVEAMAKQAHMSARNFARRFAAEVGATPHRWLTRQRLIAAQQMLESTSRSIDEIAEAVGMGNAMTLRHHFRRELKTSPSAYRARFSLASRP